MKRIAVTSALLVLALSAAGMAQAQRSHASDADAELLQGVAGDELATADFHGPLGGDMAGPGMGGHRRGGRALRGLAMRRLEQLGLSEQQKTRIADIRDEHEKEAIRMQSDLRLARLELRKLLRAEQPNVRAIDSQIDRLSTIRGEMMKSGIRSRIEVRSVLTPKQRQKLREMPLERGRQGKAGSRGERRAGPGRAPHGAPGERGPERGHSRL